MRAAGLPLPSNGGGTPKLYYLRKKVACEKIELDVIRDVDLNKLEPWDIQEECKIGSTPQNDWYFFSHKDKKYPTGTRTNRATAAGFWKATGRDKVIYASIKQIGMRKTLVFYKGRASHGHKSDWIMHEYRLDDTKYKPNDTASLMGEATEDGWVICRVFKKKNHHKSFQSPNNCSHSMSRSDGKTELLDCSSALGQILQYMGRSSKEETRQGIIINNDNFFSSSQNIRHPRLTETILSDGLQFHERRFMKLPALQRPTALIPNNYPQQHHHLDHSCGHQTAVSADTIINDAVVDTDQPISSGIDGWSVVDDRTDQLNGEEEEAEALKQLPCCFELEDLAGPSFLLSQVCSPAQTGDLWSI